MNTRSSIQDSSFNVGDLYLGIVVGSTVIGGLSGLKYAVSETKKGDSTMEAVANSILGTTAGVALGMSIGIIWPISAPAAIAGLIIHKIRQW